MKIDNNTDEKTMEFLLWVLFACSALNGLNASGEDDVEDDDEAVTEIAAKQATEMTKRAMKRLPK